MLGAPIWCCYNADQERFLRGLNNWILKKCRCCLKGAARWGWEENIVIAARSPSAALPFSTCIYTLPSASPSDSHNPRSPMSIPRQHCIYMAHDEQPPFTRPYLHSPIPEHNWLNSDKSVKRFRKKKKRWQVFLALRVTSENITRSEENCPPAAIFCLFVFLFLASL